MNNEQIELFLSEMDVLLKHDVKPARLSQDNELLIIQYLCENHKTVMDALLFISRYHGFSSILLSVRYTLSLHLQGCKIHEKLVDKFTLYASEKHWLYSYLKKEEIEMLMESYILNKRFALEKLGYPITELSLQDIFHITKVLGCKHDTLFEIANTALEYQYEEWIKGRKGK